MINNFEIKQIKLNTSSKMNDIEFLKSKLLEIVDVMWKKNQEIHIQINFIEHLNV